MKPPLPWQTDFIRVMLPALILLAWAVGYFLALWWSVATTVVEAKI